MFEILKHVLFPWRLNGTIDFDEGSRKLPWMIVVGLVPLMLLIPQNPDLATGYWVLALYSGLIWAVYFHHSFRPPQVSILKALFAFITTGVSAGFLFHHVAELPPFATMYAWRDSSDTLHQVLGWIWGTGLQEEAWKLVVPCLIAATSSQTGPREILFYGIVSGLGFGIYEGLLYQTDRNVDFAGGNLGTYYLLNVFRLTSAPFTHAVWAGISTYFAGTAICHRRFIPLMIIIGLTITSVIHGLVDFLPNRAGLEIYGFGLEVLGVCLFCAYRARILTFDHLMSKT